MAQQLEVAPGSVVLVRDEEWLVTSVDTTTDGSLLHVQGLSELVRDTQAYFYASLDEISVVDPASMRVRADDSPGYRRARLWLEATLRKTVLPVDSDDLSVNGEILADPLEYQHSAVRQALSTENLRPRILLADAVGLGKTLEIGMILAELVRRGRGERILIVSPRHVLEQMQHEMWARFALPFVRLDSVGIQRVRQKLPATRNPFTMYKRAIISIDTLKNDRYLAHLRKHRWDAVVIDESHNVTNSSTQNNRLARTLAPNTDALILASATPHNGRAEAFAELIRLLEPTAVTPEGVLREGEVNRLIVRRHRYSDEVKTVVGADWAERAEPLHLLAEASPEEDAVANELVDTWLNPPGPSPYSGATTALFPWTLAKAFLSSPAALVATCRERTRRLTDLKDPAQQREREALLRLDQLAEQASSATTPVGKYGKLVQRLEQVDVRPGSTTRAVIFAERIATLNWLAASLRRDLKFDTDAVRILHGGLTDVDQQAIVESFKQTTSSIRILVTGDVASEGVNLHLQCHHLIHYDIPWSLIRIEQRNGRIDRYGQKHPPQITTLLLDPSNARFGGDLRVLTRLLQKEDEAHRALGDAASLMGKAEVKAEEDEIRKVLAGQREFDDVVADVGAVASGTDIYALIARLQQQPSQAPATSSDSPPGSVTLYESAADYLEEALHEICPTPGAKPTAGGVHYRRHPQDHLLELCPPTDLAARLDVLPQSYLAERRVKERLVLATTKAKGKSLLAAALSDESESTWPEAHFLGPLHPVLDWVSDRALAALPRGEVFAVRGDVERPTVLLLGTLTNKEGRTVSSVWLTATVLGATWLVQPHDSAAAMLRNVGFGAIASNPGPPAGSAALSQLIPDAVSAVREHLVQVLATAEQRALDQVQAWSTRIADWQNKADTIAQRQEIKARRLSVADELALARGQAPERQLVRPLLVVVPADTPVEKSGGPHAGQ